MNHSAFDIIVVGGGIAGLAAAYDLQARGLRVRVLEASSRVGGAISTERFDDWIIDGGPDSLLVQKPAAVALCRELGIGDRLIPTLTPRTAYVLRDGRLHAIAEGSFLGFPITFGALASSGLFSLAVLLPGIAVTARRLHDTDRSGWLQLIGLIPLIGWIIMIVWCVQEAKEPNRFGSAASS